MSELSQSCPLLTCLCLTFPPFSPPRSNMMTVMERAIEAGQSVLVENMGESIDAVLNPVITRSTFKKGRNMYVKLGDKEVEYNKNFRLFLHTKLSNPHYPPEIQAETPLINFTVTEQVRGQAFTCILRTAVSYCTALHPHYYL